MFALLLALFGRLVLAQLVVAVALGVLVGAAALIEGHVPDVWRLRAVALGGGAAVGAAWVVAGFRREAGDVALAGLGAARRLMVLLGVLAGAPVLALAGGLPAQAASFVEVGVLRWSGGEARWSDGSALRSDRVGPAAVFPGLPAPVVAATTRIDLLFPARLLALAAALSWLLRRPMAPDVPAALGAGAVATLLGLVPALLS